MNITIQQDCAYQVHILMRKWEGGFITNGEDVHCLLDRFSSASTCKFCPGIDWTHYQQHYFNVIRFDLKSVRCTEAPFYRVDSVNCKLWFELPSNAKLADKALGEVLCSACKRLVSDLNWQLERTMSESPSKKIKQQAASSRAKLTYMSPGSRMKRSQRAIMERGVDKRKLARYEATEVALADEQHTEMCSVMDAIDQVAADDLQCIFEEGEALGVGGKLREIWTTDKREQKEEFQKDQAKNGKCLEHRHSVNILLNIFLFLMLVTGKRSNQWSMVTIRMGKTFLNTSKIIICFVLFAALTIFTRSAAAYEALKSFDILQLPSRSLLQSYTGTFLHESGASK